MLRLTDALIDSSLDKESFLARKEALLIERRSLEDLKSQKSSNYTSVIERVSQFLELAESAYFLYKMLLSGDKAEFLKNTHLEPVGSGENA